tara:strand:- start:3060 stop:4025 length:966 start_codon:yes stop_codon:yes gene_type:complete
MNTSHITSIIKKIIAKNVKLTHSESVCIVTDTNKLSLAQAFIDEVKQYNSDPILVTMNPRNQHGSEVPLIISGAMKAADVVFQIVTHAMTHTDATQEALKSGSRILVLRGITDDLMLYGAINANYNEISIACHKVANLMKDAKLIQLLSPAGTNLTMSIENRNPHILDGIVKGPGTFAAMPDGETAISPVETTTEGLLVIEHSMDGVGLLDAPIYLTITQGKVLSIEGKQSAQKLQNLIDQGDANSNNIAEFAIGTNPKARLVGNLAEDKKLEGSVHVAIGDNHVLGGTVISNIHLDGMVLNPTVHIDNKCIIDNGKLQLD